MKQRFTKRTRLVSALLTLAMVFTFLPFSALAAASQEIEELAFTTHGCDALQITKGGSIADWIAAFRKKWRTRTREKDPSMQRVAMGSTSGRITMTGSWRTSHTSSMPSRRPAASRVEKHTICVFQSVRRKATFLTPRGTLNLKRSQSMVKI